MGLFKKIFGKNKNKEENQSSVVIAPMEQADEEKPEPAPQKAPAAKAEPAVEKPKTTAPKTAEVKTEAPAAKAQAAEAKPAAQKSTPAKKPAAKPAEKSTEKPAAKASEPAKKTTLDKVREALAEKKPAAELQKDEKKEVKKEEKKEVKKVEKPVAEEAKGADTFTGCFEIKRSKDDRYVFNLYASNHVIVATSQIYSSAASAMNGIKSVIANAESAPVEDQTLKTYETLTYPKWEIYMDKGENYRFRLNASNGSTICHSQGYTSKANCKNGIESIRRSVKNAQIDKAYLQKEDATK